VTTDAAEAGADDRPGTRPRWTQRLLGPLTTVVLSTLAMAQAIQVWNWRPDTPMELDGDGAYVLMQVKEILDHGWYWSNPDVGAPFGQQSGWFSDASWIHFLVIRIIGLVSSSPFTVSALYFFVCFPLAALAAYWLSRRVGISRTGAVVVGVLFSVLPGHQHRFGHLWLDGYWVVPIAFWLVLAAVDRLPSTPDVTTTRKRVGVVAAVVVVGLGGVYYVAFTVILLVALMLFGLVARTGRGTLVRSGLVVAGVGLVCLVPMTLASLQVRGDTVTGPVPGQRGFWQSEDYAGKIVDLALPWIQHRVPELAQVTANYTSATTPSPEQPALGLVAAVGLGGLLLVGLAQLMGRPRSPRTAMFGVLTLLALTALAFYTRGGLGALSAFVLTPSIRTWSRLVTVLALLGLLAAGLALTSLAHRRGRALAASLAVLAVLIGVLDQTNPALAPDYSAQRAKASNLTAYTTALERSLAPGCAVFQYPVVPFPEQPPVAGMAAYEQLQPYLTSSQLAWSFGAMRGTEAADWQRTLPPLGDDGILVDDLAAADFCAVELDGAGVDASDEAARVLTGLLGFSVATTPDGRLQAFDLRGRRQQLVDAVGADSVARRGQVVLHRVPAHP
jgi:hypothetical protein